MKPTVNSKLDVAERQLVAVDKMRQLAFDILYALGCGRKTADSVATHSVSAPPH